MLFRIQGSEHVDVPLPEFVNPGRQVGGVARVHNDSIEPFLRRG